LRAQRIETLNYLSSGKKGVFIVPMAGLRKIIPPQDEWKNYQIHLQVGTELALETEILKLVQMGYSRVDMVNTPGDFSVRGGIIDIYPLTEENPVRIELFDAEIDSIRTFSIDDQRSIEKRDFVTVGPASE